MSDVTKLVVSNVLCFLTNKINSKSDRQLKSLLSDYYSVDELSSAKDLLMSHVDMLKVPNFPKIVRQHRHSAGRSGHELDDMVTALTFMDENKLLELLPTFVATGPDKMPSTRLVEGDISVLWDKLSLVQSSIESLQQANEATVRSSKEIIEMLKSVGKKIRDIGASQNVLKDAILNIERSGKGGTASTRSGSNVLSLSGIASGVGQGLTRADQEALDSTSVNFVINEGRPGYMANIILPSTSHNHTVDCVQQLGGRGPKPSNSDLTIKSDGELRDSNIGDSTWSAKINMRNVKRKEREPLLSPSYEAQAMSKKPNLGSRNYAAALSSGQVNVAVQRSVAGQEKTIGNSCKHKLEAAKQVRAEKAVFCLGNVAASYTTRDIRDHCNSIGIHVLFCYDISFDDEGPRYFKLAVRAADRDIVMNSESWPSRVFVRIWHQRNSGDNAVSHSESDPIAVSVGKVVTELRKRVESNRHDLQLRPARHPDIPMGADKTSDIAVVGIVVPSVDSAVSVHQLAQRKSRCSSQLDLHTDCGVVDVDNIEVAENGHLASISTYDKAVMVVDNANANSGSPCVILTENDTDADVFVDTI